MSKTSLFLLAAIVLVFFVTLTVIFRSPASTTSEVVQLTPQEHSGGEVDVKVTPKILFAGELPQFKLEFNTHSVELNFDIEAISTLNDNFGRSYGKPTWEGSPPEGHHRSGALTFQKPLEKATSATLSLKNISGVESREFTWQL